MVTKNICVEMASVNFGTYLLVLFLLFLFFVTASYAQGSGTIVYTRDQLIGLCRPVLLPGAKPEIPKEL